MCAQRFQKPLNLNIRKPERIDKRNAHTGRRAGEWDTLALLSAQEATHTGRFDLAFFFIL